MQKYELTDETRQWYGRTLHRIRALKDFTTITGEEIKAGDLGGFVEKLENLSQDGAAWVYDNARVFGAAWVYDNAEVYGDAWVYGDAEVCGKARVQRTDHFLVVGPIGSRNGFTTFFRDKDNEITVKCGCFLGKITDFLNKVDEAHGDSKHAVVYRAAVELAKAQIDLEEKND